MSLLPSFERHLHNMLYTNVLTQYCEFLHNIVKYIMSLILLQLGYSGFGDTYVICNI